MATASINFKIVTSTSERHNTRGQELSYTIPELVEENSSWQADQIAEREREIRRLCKEISGRKMQKNAEPIREAVVVLDEDHTMEDLKKLSAVLKEKHQLDCFQIHHHKDEGRFTDKDGKTVATRENHLWHVSIKGEKKKVKTLEEVKALRPDAQWKCNHHAHMIFDWQDRETGKTRKLTKIDLSKIQDTVAETLKMDRGQHRVNSNRQRLEPIEYKRQQEEKRLYELQQQVALEQKKNEAAADAYRDAQSEYNKLEGENLAEQEKVRQRASELLKTGGEGLSEVRQFSEEEISRAISIIDEQIPKLEKGIQQYKGNSRKLTEGIQTIQSSHQYQQFKILRARVIDLRKKEDEERAGKSQLKEAAERVRQGKKPW